MIASLVLSFTEYDVIRAPRFTGLDNYRQLMSDPAVAKSLGLPVMTPAVAVGILFLFLLNGQQGLINGMLALVGIEGPNWTTDPAWIKPGIVLMSLWTLGSTTIIYLAALNNVPSDLYEAARVDGPATSSCSGGSPCP